MSNVVVIGTQWGDEGKGKIVDLLTQYAHYIARFQGGNNAGHTLVVDNLQHIFNIIPSGILHAGKVCLIGNGLVVDPAVLIAEIKRLKDFGIDLTPKNFVISDKVHLIMPYHIAMDNARESAKGDKKIGTTARGIGPCYEDKAARTGIRADDLRHPDNLMEKISAGLAEKNFLLKNLYLQKTVSLDAVFHQYKDYGKILTPFIGDVSRILYEAIKSGKNVLFEGAQGTHLDIDHGTYPFVTSSNTVSAEAAIGTGLGPNQIDRVVGIMKAYTTRVGAGPFPTELDDMQGNYIQKKGKEFGATTGRKRRCGWLDLVVVADSIRMSDINTLAVTKLDILGGLDYLKICTAYELDGNTIHHRPVNLEELARCKPVYEHFEGWEDDISGIRDYNDLPRNAKEYLEFIQNTLGIGIGIVSVGPERESTIMRSNPFICF